MARCLCILALGVCAGALLQGAAGAQDAAPGGPFVVICPVEGEIDEGVRVLVERAVEEARGAEALILRIDTPGGRVDSAIEITNSLLAADCTTIAYIEGMGAISAGALISYACDHMVMAPATNIGASTPIMMGMETTEDMNEKSMSFVRAKYRALGEEKGHNPLLGEAMVDRGIEIRGIRNEDGTWRMYKVQDGGAMETYETEKLVNTVFEALETTTGEDLTEVKDSVRKALGAQEGDEGAAPAAEDAAVAVQGEEVPDLEHAVVISPAGKLLTLTGKEALDYGLIRATLDSLEDTLEYFGHGELRRVEVEPTWEEIIFAWLTSPTIAGLLLMAGIAGIVTEVRTPGFGVPGIVGGICLFLFFGAHLVLGMADWIDIALVLAGLMLIGAEIFLLPGFGIAGISGIACLFVGIYLTLTKVPIPQYDWDFQRLEDAGQTMVTAAITAAVFSYVAWKVLPRTPLPGWLTLGTEQVQEAGYVVQSREEEQQWIGQRGVTTSVLRPAGRGRFGDKTLDIVTRGEFLEQGVEVEIIEVKGNRLVVTAVEGN